MTLYGIASRLRAERRALDARGGTAGAQHPPTSPGPPGSCIATSPPTRPRRRPHQRLWATLQDRLVAELRLREIHTLEAPRPSCPPTCCPQPPLCPAPCDHAVWQRPPRDLADRLTAATPAASPGTTPSTSARASSRSRAARTTLLRGLPRRGPRMPRCRVLSTISARLSPIRPRRRLRPRPSPRNAYAPRRALLAGRHLPLQTHLHHRALTALPSTCASPPPTSLQTFSPPLTNLTPSTHFHYSTHFYYSTSRFQPLIGFITTLTSKEAPAEKPRTVPSSARSVFESGPCGFTLRLTPAHPACTQRSVPASLTTLGSRASRSWSPSKLNPSTTVTMATPLGSATHQARAMYPYPSRSIDPQLGVGG